MLTRGSNFESIFYELRPYLYLVIAFVALSHAGSPLGNLSSLLLLIGASIIIHSRLKYRGVLRF